MCVCVSLGASDPDVPLRPSTRAFGRRGQVRRERWRRHVRRGASFRARVARRRRAGRARCRRVRLGPGACVTCATCIGRRATCNRRRATCGVQRATCRSNASRQASIFRAQVIRAPRGVLTGTWRWRRAGVLGSTQGTQGYSGYARVLSGGGIAAACGTCVTRFSVRAARQHRLSNSLATVGAAQALERV
jgi:hypothetical protein